MIPEEIFRYIASFIGGGFAVAVGNWLHASRAKRKETELSQLMDQLKYLYGPVSFFTHRNQSLFDLSDSIHKAYGKEFIDKKWSQEPLAQDRIREQAMATLDLSNTYIEQVVENNKKLLAILQANWHFVDLQDVDEFMRFQIDSIRLETEVRDEERPDTPLAIYRALGEISFMRPTLIQLVSERVSQKNNRIATLMKKRPKPGRKKKSNSA